MLLPSNFEFPYCNVLIFIKVDCGHVGPNSINDTFPVCNQFSYITSTVHIYVPIQY